MVCVRCVCGTCVCVVRVGCVCGTCVVRVCACVVCARCVRVEACADPRPALLQVKGAKSEQEARRLQLRSLQYLERYVYLVLFNAYLHLEKADSWQRPFSTWMREVRGGGPGCLAGPC